MAHIVVKGRHALDLQEKSCIIEQAKIGMLTAAEGRAKVAALEAKLPAVSVPPAAAATPSSMGPRRAEEYAEVLMIPAKHVASVGT